MRIVPLVVVALFACSKDPQAEVDKEVASFLADGVKTDLLELKQAIASPDPGSGKYKCAHMANIAKLEKGHKALADELRQLCTKDLYLAMIKLEVEKAEAARKAKPDEKVLSECYNANYAFAKEGMTEAKTVDLAKDLIARFEAACPDAK